MQTHILDIARQHPANRPLHRPLMQRIQIANSVRLIACALGIWVGVVSGTVLAEEKDTKAATEDPAKCPVIGGTIKKPEQRHTAAAGMTNADWWPNQLNLRILHQNSPVGNPLGGKFNYAEEFKKL